MTYDVDINGRRQRVEIERTGSGCTALIDGRRYAADVTVINGVWSLLLEEQPRPGTPPAPGRVRSYDVAVAEQPPESGNLSVHVGGRVVTASVGRSRGSWTARAHDGADTRGGPRSVAAPMPGRVVKVLVQPGDTVVARQGVAVVEAMKMENELRAPRAGVVTAVRVSEGASVEAGAVLVVIE